MGTRTNDEMTMCAVLAWATRPPLRSPQKGLVVGSSVSGVLDPVLGCRSWDCINCSMVSYSWDDSLEENMTYGGNYVSISFLDEQQWDIPINLSSLY